MAGTNHHLILSAIGTLDYNLNPNRWCCVCANR